jgi:hypothetical protein
LAVGYAFVAYLAERERSLYSARRLTEANLGEITDRLVAILDER